MAGKKRSNSASASIGDLGLDILSIILSFLSRGEMFRQRQITSAFYAASSSVHTLDCYSLLKMLDSLSDTRTMSLTLQILGATTIRKIWLPISTLELEYQQLKQLKSSAFIFFGTLTVVEFRHNYQEFNTPARFSRSGAALNSRQDQASHQQNGDRFKRGYFGSSSSDGEQLFQEEGSCGFIVRQ
jgi:hypothetical protein